jgi:hypothetical protein
MTRVGNTLGLVAGLVVAVPAPASWFYTTDRVGIAAEVVGDGLIDTDEYGTNRTIRLWAVLPSGWRLDVVAGNTTQPLHLSTDGVFFQSMFGGSTSMDINPAFYPLAPEVQWDSFMTIGAEDNAGTGAVGEANNLSHIGVDFSGFDAGGAIDSDNGSWFIIPTDLQGWPSPFVDACGRGGNGVLIAQLTLLGAESSVTCSALMQGSDEFGETWQRHLGTFTVDPDGMSNGAPEVACGADIDGNGTIDVHDLLLLIAAWDDGACADISGDAKVDSEDFLFLASTWGPCTPPE